MKLQAYGIQNIEFDFLKTWKCHKVKGQRSNVNNFEATYSPRNDFNKKKQSSLTQTDENGGVEMMYKTWQIRHCLWSSSPNGYHSSQK